MKIVFIDQDDYPSFKMNNKLEQKNGVIAVPRNSQSLDTFQDHDLYIEKWDDGRYQCIICGKVSVNRKRSDMRKHIEIHIDGLSYTCDICQKKFKSKNSLSTHKSTVHNKPCLYVM